MIKCRLRFVKGLCAGRTLYCVERGGEITKSAAARALLCATSIKAERKNWKYCHEYVGVAFSLGLSQQKAHTVCLTSFLHSAHRSSVSVHWGSSSYCYPFVRFCSCALIVEMLTKSVFYKIRQHCWQTNGQFPSYKYLFLCEKLKRKELIFFNKKKIIDSLKLFYQNLPWISGLEFRCAEIRRTQFV